jgi:hypothetical protein
MLSVRVPEESDRIADVDFHEVFIAADASVEPEEVTVSLVLAGHPANSVVVYSRRSRHCSSPIYNWAVQQCHESDWVTCCGSVDWSRPKVFQNVWTR